MVSVKHNTLVMLNEWVVTLQCVSFMSGLEYVCLGLIFILWLNSYPEHCVVADVGGVVCRHVIDGATSREP